MNEMNNIQQKILSKRQKDHKRKFEEISFVDYNDGFEISPNTKKTKETLFESTEAVSECTFRYKINPP